MDSPDLGSPHWTGRRTGERRDIGALGQLTTASLMAGSLALGLAMLGCGSGSTDAVRDTESTEIDDGGAASSTGSPATVTSAGAESSGDAESSGGMEPAAPSDASDAAGNGGMESATPSDAGALADAQSGGAAAVEFDGYEVQVDPYGNCPLVAVVNVHGIEPSEVERLRVVVAGRDGAPDFEREYSPADADFAAQLSSPDLTFSEPGFHVPVLGLYADADNSVQVVLELQGGDPVGLTLNIETRLTTPDESVWVPTIQVDTAMTELMEPGWTVAEINIEPDPPPPIVFVDWTRTIAFDERGAVRWALRPDLPLGETFTTTRSMTGNFLTGSFDTIVELNKLGRTTRSFQVSGYSIHHEILQIGSDDPGHASPGTSGEHLGNLLVLASKDDASTIQDQILELSLESGEILGEWDLATVLDRDRTTYIDPERWSPGVGDWFHGNGLAYSNMDESIIVSGRHQGVAKIRRDETLVWLLAPHDGWNEPQAQKLLTAVDANAEPYDDSVQLGNEAAGDPSLPEFGWPFGQHAPVLLPNGDLLLFDNGSSRHWGPVCGVTSRAVIYRVDEAAMTVRQMGQYILSRSDSSCFVSNTHLLPATGNLFIQPGSTYFDSGTSTTIVREVATRIEDDGMAFFGAVVFDATLDMSVIPSGSAPYSFRGHRWTF